MSRFELVVVSLGGTWDSGLPIAAARAGALGILDLAYLRDPRIARAALERLCRHAAGGRYGLLLPGRVDNFSLAALDALSGAECVVLLPDRTDRFAEMIGHARRAAARVGLVATSIADARLAAELGCDFVFAKGHEAGGMVGEETGFVLLQRLTAWGELPVYAWGGMGTQTVAAAEVAGAAGAILDWQLALVNESALPAAAKRRLASFDGSETAVVQYADDRWFRFHHQPRADFRSLLEPLADRCHYDRVSDASEFDAAVTQLLSRSAERDRLLLLGQDAAFAPRLARQANSVAKALRLFDDSRRAAVSGAARSKAIAPGSPLAVSHGTEYPVVQGPMTHVSDVPEFAFAVAENGGLPFLALALARGEKLRHMLEKTKHLLGDRPWGVGVLGFVPQELRAEQMPLVEEICPTHAIIAGGRPDQAASLEARGIQTYLHVPSPGMLDTFLREGARRFVFEGRECGGHVGPRTSFVLWQSMIEVLLDAKLSRAESEKVHVLFAGGIHDERSAAMVAALAQPLVESGIKFGVLLGTAYLATQEIVDTGAVVDGFRDVTLASDRTVLLETGPGHAIRCADTDFVRAFQERKQELKAAGRSHEEIRDELEHLNLGRLRMASKGIARADSPAPGASLYCEIDSERQLHQGMYMLGQVAALRGDATTLRQLHESVTTSAVERLASFETQVEVVREPAEPKLPQLDIAVVGIGCLLPGATDPADYWDNILKKRDLVQEIPADRFEVDRWFDADPSARDKIYSRWGGFVPRVLFDPLKYGIPPAALKSIEPMQLMALELVARALSDSGYAEHNPNKARTSVILGVGGGAAELGVGYGFRSLLPKFLENPDEAVLRELPEWTEDSFAGILLNVVAGRVANRFDFGGANFTVDAACASSLAAVYLACRELQTGACDMVVSGGCDTMQGPMGYLCFAKTGALSPRGRSRPFEATADGIAISEGHAAVVLKRRVDAERDGDRIYAVIRGAAGGSDGRHKGLTAPRLEGQLHTLERAYRQAGFSPASIGLFEAHGTGTAVGDQAECLALGSLLADANAPEGSVALGSVKSMIGHTKCAAGVSGLIKAALALHHRVLPPTLHVEQPNPKAGLDRGPLYVNSELRPWLAGDETRRAGVSAFGFGGSNFHVVLEEYQGEAGDASRRMPHRELPAELFVFQAGTPERLAQSVRAFAKELDGALAAGAEFSLADLAYTHHLKQASIEGVCRAAIVATSKPQLAERLNALLDKLANPQLLKPTPGVFFSLEPLAPSTPLAMLFPGQGSQFPDMLRDLAVAFREVGETFQRADEALAERLESNLSRYIFPPPRFSDEARSQDAETLKQTRLAQPALGAADVATLKLLASFGIAPDVAAGHSYGELVALFAAGAYDESALFQLSAERGQAMFDLASGDSTDRGAMLAASASADEIVAALGDCRNVWLANLNSPRQTVVSGTTPGIEEAELALSAAGISHQRIPVGCAFHTPLMSPASKRFGSALKQVELGALNLPVFSNLHAASYPRDAQGLRETLVGQIEGQVRFRDQIEALYAAGTRVFLEVGPGRVLSGLVRDILGDRPHVAITTQPRGGCGIANLLAALAELFAQGVSIDFERLYEGRRLKSLQLRQLTQQARTGPPAHHWWLQGNAIWPSREEPRAYPERGRFVRTSDQAALASEAPALEISSPAESSATEAFVSVPSPSESSDLLPSSFPSPEQETDSLRWAQPTTETSAHADAHAQFQQTMRQFLEVQRSVMLAFLGQPDAILSQPTQSMLPTSYAPPTNGEANHAVRYEAHPAHQNGLAHVPHVAAPAPPPMVAPVAAQPAPVAPAPQPRFEAPPAPAPVAEAPQSAPAEPVAEATPLDEQLLNIVSQRTGYPAEMLDQDANLEADLGIDSIKRVEIISAFRRETLPDMKEPPAAFMERMTAAKTMRAILEVVGDFRGQANGAKAVKSSANNGRAPRSASSNGHAERETVDCPRCIPAVVEAPLTTPGTNASMRGMWVVTDDRLGVSQSLVRAVAALGGECAILAKEDLASRDAAASALANIRAAGMPLRGVFHLAPLSDVPVFPQLTAAEWNSAADAEVKSLLYLLQANASELAAEREDPFTVISATRGAGDFGQPSGDECAQPWRGGIAGMLKVAAREWPKARFRTIDFVELPDAETLVIEALTQGPIDVGYRCDRRLSIEAKRDEHPIDEPSEPAVELNSKSVVLVLAGGKGITATIACEISERTRATMILAGRSPAPGDEDPSLSGIDDPAELRRRILLALREELNRAPELKQVERRYQQLMSDREIRQTLAAIASAGSRVEYVSCDVQNPEQLERLVREIEARHGGIDAIVHGAGVIEDKYIVDKAADSFDRVVDTKVNPLLTLSRILDPARLKALVIFSSVSGFFGNPGQVDYSTANEMLNRMARRLRDVWQTKIVALCWGPWTGAGMVKPEVARQFEERGVGMISVPAGRRAAWREIVSHDSRDVRVVLGPGVWVESAENRAAQGALAPANTPLLRQETVWRDAQGAVRATLTLDGRERPFLKDHIIDGRAVLPLAFAMEAMAELAQAAEPQLQVAEIVDLRQLKGIVLTTDALELPLVAERLERTRDGAKWRVRVIDPTLPARPHYEATIVLARELKSAPSAPELESLSGEFPLDIEEGYRRWLFHGPLYQAIDFYRGYDESGIDCILRPSEPSACLGREADAKWLIDPVILDVGPQLAALWSRAQTDTMLLPSRLSAYERYAPIGTDPVECYFRVAKTDGSTVTADVWFVRNDQVLGVFKNLESAGSRELNRITGGVLV